MQETLMRAARQPHIAIGTLSVALLAIAITYGWDAGRFAHSISEGSLLLAALLIGGTILAYQFPIYIRHNIKICVVASPLYLMSVLLPVPLAITAVGFAVTVGELMVRRTCGTYPSDIATTVGRWILLSLAGSLVGHATLGGHGGMFSHNLPLLGAALVLWLGDPLTLPLALAPITGEKPTRIISTVIRQGGVAEGAQYLLGMLGAVAAIHQAWALVMLTVPAVLVYLAFKKEMDEDTFQLLESMADTVDLRDPYTGGHSRRVAELATGVLNEIGMRGQEATLIRTAARIHDLGRIDLPDTVLIKASALTPEEESLVQSYPDRGAELLNQYPDFSRGIEMVRHHCERWDGMGYPDGLAGTAIPFGARMIAVVDSFDAMTSERPYRRALPLDRAAEILRDGRGRQWDSQLVDVFLSSISHKLAGPMPQLLPLEAPASSVGTSLTA